MVSITLSIVSGEISRVRNSLSSNSANRISATSLPFISQSPTVRVASGPDVYFEARLSSYPCAFSARKCRGKLQRCGGTCDSGMWPALTAFARTAVASLRFIPSESGRTWLVSFGSPDFVAVVARRVIDVVVPDVFGSSAAPAQVISPGSLSQGVSCPDSLGVHVFGKINWHR